MLGGLRCTTPGCSAAFHEETSASEHRRQFHSQALQDSRLCLATLVQHGKLPTAIDALRPSAPNGGRASISVNHDGVLSCSATGAAHFTSVAGALAALGVRMGGDVVEVDAWDAVMVVGTQGHTLGDVWRQYLAEADVQDDESLGRLPPQPVKREVKYEKV